MAEADGSLLIVAPQDLLKGFIPNEECGGVAWDDIVSLYEFSGASKSFLSLSPILQAYADEPFATNGLYAHEKGVVILVFGDIWMDIIKEIVLTGNNIEIYGQIEDEYGRRQFYTLNKETRYVGEHNSEADDDLNQAMSEWLKTLPRDIINMTPQILSC